MFYNLPILSRSEFHNYFLKLVVFKINEVKPGILFIFKGQYKGLDRYLDANIKTIFIKSVKKKGCSCYKYYKI